jgi:hypothetical protein
MVPARWASAPHRVPARWASAPHRVPARWESERRMALAHQAPASGTAVAHQAPGWHPAGQRRCRSPWSRRSEWTSCSWEPRGAAAWSRTRSASRLEEERCAWQQERPPGVTRCAWQQERPPGVTRCAGQQERPPEEEQRLRSAWVTFPAPGSTVGASREVAAMRSVVPAPLPAAHPEPPRRAASPSAPSCRRTAPRPACAATGAARTAWRDGAAAGPCRLARVSLRPVGSPMVRPTARPSWEPSAGNHWGYLACLCSLARSRRVSNVLIELRRGVRKKKLGLPGLRTRALTPVRPRR